MSHSQDALHYWRGVWGYAPTRKDIPMKKREKVPVIRPNRTEGFIVEPAPGNGCKLVVMRNVSTGFTKIGISTIEDETCQLSDVALRAVAKQLNALVRGKR